MVLMSGSSRARQQDSLVNRPSCGGNKKSGLVRFVGMNSNISLGRFAITSETQPGLACTGAIYRCARNQTCAGGVGRQVNMRHCGEGAPSCGGEGLIEDSVRSGRNSSLVTGSFPESYSSLFTVRNIETVEIGNTTKHLSTDGDGFISKKSCGRYPGVYSSGSPVKGDLVSQRSFAGAAPKALVLPRTEPRRVNQPPLLAARV